MYFSRISAVDCLGTGWAGATVLKPPAEGGGPLENPVPGALGFRSPNPIIFLGGAVGAGCCGLTGLLLRSLRIFNGDIKKLNQNLLFLFKF